MSVEQQLRSGLAALAVDPPPAGDRVAAVEGRVRRRARRRASGAVVLTAVACLGVAGLTTLPGPAERPPVAAEAPQLTARDLLRPMVAVRVEAAPPGSPRDAAVDRELQALQPALDNVSRRTGDAREVLFTRGVDAARLEAFVDGVQQRAVEPALMVLQVEGSAVELRAPLSPALQRELGDRLPEMLPALRDTLRVYTVGRPAGGVEVTVAYEAWALDQRTLDRVVGLFARSVGADAADVRVRALP